MLIVKRIIKNIPVVNFISLIIWRTILRIVVSIGMQYRRLTFLGSKNYWEGNYASGRTSGSGSYGKLAEFKAEVLNSFVKKYKVNSVTEFGCGDGNQLSLAAYPEYIGLDVSNTAIRLCKERFQGDDTKKFFVYDPQILLTRRSYRADLVLSLDVIFHLVENRIFELYMRHLFSASERFVVIYSGDTDVKSLMNAHIRHRSFSWWIKQNMPTWKLTRKIPNKYPYKGDSRTGSRSEFFIYEKT